MAKKKSSKKNTEKASAKSTAKSRSRSNTRGTGKNNKYTPKNKAEVLENQESWNLEPEVKPEAEIHTEPAEVSVPHEPAETSADVRLPESPADNGTKVIDIEDYQPVIWIQPETAAAPEEKPEEPIAPVIESEEAPAIEKNKEFVSEPEEEPAVEKQEKLVSWPEKAHAAEEHEKTVSGPARSRKHVLPNRAARIAGAAFFAVLVIMFVLNLITPDILYSDQENRVFQQLPKFSIGNYLSGRFESQLDNYVSDQFAGRGAFIKIKSSADLTIGQIKANGVFKARDSYLMEDITYPDEDSFKADIKALKTFRKKNKKKKMYFMLVPNAANILSDKLPDGVVTHDQNADMDRLFNAVKKMGYEPIDIREELAEASKKQQVYYRTDHHWTTDGAFIAYQKAADIMKLKSKTEYEPYTVKNDFVGTLNSKSGFTSGRKDAIRIYLPKGDKYLNSVIRYKDKQEKTTMYYDMANLDIKDAYTVFGGTNQSLITISTPTKKNRHLLVVKDSYANCFIPFLTQDYRTITIVDPRYYYENIATVMKADEIDDVLFLYNANTYFDDNYMRMMLTNK